jgi:hypothetical protein
MHPRELDPGDSQKYSALVFGRRGTPGGEGCGRVMVAFKTQYHAPLIL